MLRGTRVLLVGAVLSLSTVLGGVPPTQAQQVDPQAQLSNINAQKDVWQRRLDQARSRISQSSQSLSAAKVKLDQTKASLSVAKVNTDSVTSTNTQQIGDLKQQLVSAQSELDTIIKDNTDRQNKLISDLGANKQLTDETQGQIQATSQQIDYTKGQLDSLAKQITKIQQDQQETQQQLDVVLRQTYKEQRRSLLEFLLQSVSFGDFLTRVSNLQDIAGQQDHLLALLKTQSQQLGDAQAQQQAQMNTLLDLQDAQDKQKQTLELQRQDQQQLLEQARVQAQEAKVRISARENQVQGLISSKQGQMEESQRLLQSLKNAQDQLSSTISNQGDALTKAKQQEQAARSQLDQLEREAEGIAALINQSEAAHPTKTFSSGKLAWPERGPLMQGFGPSPYWFEPSITYNGRRYSHFHTGIDIGAPNATPIHAAADGQIIVTGYSSYGYGNYIIVAHNPKLATLYAHLSRIAVGKGAIVKQGQIIGYEGTTGNSTGPHLHFEVRIDGQFVNPLGYL